MEQENDNPIAPNEKRIPNHSRYALSDSGFVRNIMTGSEVKKDEFNRVKIFNDEGERKWYKINDDVISELFKVVEPEPEPTIEERFTREILPANSEVIESTSGAIVANETQPVAGKQKAKNSKRDLSDDDIRQLRHDMDNGLKAKDAGPKSGINSEHARRIWKRQYYPNVV